MEQNFGRYSASGGVDEELLTLHDDTLIQEVSGLQLRVRNLKRFRGRSWLDGECVEACLRLQADGETSFNTAVASSYLWTRLETRGIQTVLETSRKGLVKLMGKEIILIPMFLGKEKHWILAAAYPNVGEIWMYDSIPGKSRLSEGERLASLLCRANLMVAGEVKVAQACNIPTQNNTYDCGMFVIQYGKHLMAGRRMRFGEVDMPRLRQEALSELMKGEPTPPPVPLLQGILEEFNMTWESGDHHCYDQNMEASTGEPVENHTQGTTSREEVAREEHVTESFLLEMGLNENERFEEHRSVSSNPHYQPSFRLLQELRRKDEPFVDIDPQGQEFTGNLNGDWKRSLKLREVLRILSANREVAWKVLFEELEKDPTIALNWFENSTKQMEDQTPYQFRFGTYRNVLKVKRFLQVKFPRSLKGTGLHQVKHKSGRQVRDGTHKKYWKKKY